MRGARGVNGQCVSISGASNCAEDVHKVGQQKMIMEQVDERFRIEVRKSDLEIEGFSLDSVLLHGQYALRCCLANHRKYRERYFPYPSEQPIAKGYRWVHILVTLCANSTFLDLSPKATPGSWFPETGKKVICKSPKQAISPKAGATNQQMSLQRYLPLAGQPLNDVVHGKVVASSSFQIPGGIVREDAEEPGCLTRTCRVPLT